MFISFLNQHVWSWDWSYSRLYWVIAQRNRGASMSNLWNTSITFILGCGTLNVYDPMGVILRKRLHNFPCKQSKVLILVNHNGAWWGAQFSYSNIYLELVWLAWHRMLGQKWIISSRVLASLDSPGHDEYIYRNVEDTLPYPPAPSEPVAGPM